MRQGAEQSAPTSFPYTITCMIMLIIINRIQLLYYSSFNSCDLLISYGFMPAYRLKDSQTYKLRNLQTKHIKG